MSDRTSLQAFPKGMPVALEPDRAEPPQTFAADQPSRAEQQLSGLLRH